MNINISLKEFEIKIDDSIVNRGSEYFTNQAVRSLKQIKTDQWVASVQGTEQYNVRISPRGGTVASIYVLPVVET